MTYCCRFSASIWINIKMTEKEQIWCWFTDVWFILRWDMHKVECKRAHQLMYVCYKMIKNQCYKKYTFWLLSSLDLVQYVISAYGQTTSSAHFPVLFLVSFLFLTRIMYITMAQFKNEGQPQIWNLDNCVLVNDFSS